MKFTIIYIFISSKFGRRSSKIRYIILIRITSRKWTFYINTCDRGELVSWDFFGNQSERSTHDIFINTYSRKSLKKIFISFINKLVGKLSLIFSAPRLIPCARHVICNKYFYKQFKNTCCYFTMYVKINKTFSSKLLKL